MGEAEALHYLGEVSLESNNYSQAVEDLSKAVSIKGKTAPAGSRALAEKEELDAIVNDIKGRIAEHKEMEKGEFTDSYVKAPGGKILSNLGVAGAVESGKPVAVETVGTA